MEETSKYSLSFLRELKGSILLNSLFCFLQGNEIDNEELGEELGPQDLHGSVKSRMDKLEAGQSVSAVESENQTSFLSSQEGSSGTDYVMA